MLAVSLFARAILGPIGFLVGILTGGGLVAACAGLAVGWTACQFLLDVPNSHRIAAAGGLPIRDPAGTSARRLLTLARLSIPLGLDKGISSLAVNVPRFAVHAALGVAALGVYGILAYLAQAITMLVSSVQLLLVSPLAEYHLRGDIRAFTRVLGKLLVFSLAVLVVAPVAAWLFGDAFLRAALGEEFADRGLLVALMLAAGVINVQRSLCKALEAAHRFKTYVVVDGVTTGVIALCASPFVARWGLDGAAWALTAGFVVGSLLVSGVIVQILREMRTRASV
jgi:O-antigen/teichoic acid export membrane protein